MDPRRFDDLLRLLPTGSRRGLLAALAGIAFAPRTGIDTAARKRKKRQQPLQRNEFGCVDVGKACRGNDDNCCSGRCDGKKPKKGKKDTSRCAAHDGSTCLAGQTVEECGGAANVACTTTLENAGQCVTTTGNAPYCFAGGGVCFRCTKDTECIPFCGAAAACVRCDGGCPETGGALCVGLGFCSNP
jgi:hypothetical protein